MTNATEWLEKQFEFEFCEECGGGACHHTAVPFIGNWFARCDHPRVEPDFELDPVVAEYRATQ
jgi:hypothetical protein